MKKWNEAGNGLIVLVALWFCCKGTDAHKFQAYKCDGDALTGAQFYRHEECNVNRGHVTEADYFIVQKNNKYNMTGGRCSIKETVRTGKNKERVVRCKVAV